jgi:GNAT superfamily N-acetyltransferase
VLREAAEYPNSFVDLLPGQERIDAGRYTLCLERSKLSSTVQRQRFGSGEVDEVLAEVRSLLRDRGRGITQWEVGSAARPPGLVSLLLARGLILDSDPVAIALVLTREPPPPGPGLTTCAVQSYEEYAVAKEVQIAAFEPPADQVASERAGLRDEWDSAPRLMHAVWLGDDMVSAGSCAPTPHGLALFGGATRPDARGRGAYRALVHARWEEARSRGLSALLTQGGAMSRPILERLGFEAVGRVDMLIDDFGA